MGPLWAPGCGEAGRPPHTAGIVGQSGRGTLGCRMNVRFCPSSHLTSSTCFRDRGSGTANSAADDPRSRPGPFKRGEMSRLRVRFARSGAAAPRPTHDLACRSRPPAPTCRPAPDPPRDRQHGQANPRVKNPQALCMVGRRSYSASVRVLCLVAGAGFPGGATRRGGLLTAGRLWCRFACCARCARCSLGGGA